VIALPRVFQGSMIASGNWPGEPEQTAAATAYSALLMPPPAATVVAPTTARFWSPEQG
jgi:hypothetical protein